MSDYGRTELQSDQDRSRSRELSAKSSKPPGKVVGYSIEQFLGAGAYGEVWSGTEKKTGRRVAIKFYTRRTSNDVELLAREVEKLIALSADRYAVQLVDVDWQADPPYFVMDYFEGGSLEDLLKSEQNLPAAQAEDLFREIGTGLMHLHGKGIFHCDLKPGNVLLDEDGKPRLADFGQARLTTEKAPSLGTLFFMAPEQADLDAVPAAKWDVYALGAILYCMLVGKPPYHSEELTEKIETSGTVEERLKQYKKSLRSAPLPTEHRNVAGVDRMLADIIDRAIAPNPNHRFESVQSIMFAMRQRELAKARRPLMILGILGPLLLLIVMSLFSWFAYRQAYVDTQQAITNKADESNEFAAKLAAKSATSKIEEYFRAVKELARSEQFIEDLYQVTQNTELNDIAAKLDDPNCNADEQFEELRLDYRANQTRTNLQKYLKWRIDKAKDGLYPECASWFVNDLRGMQVASVFRTDPDSITIGRNYSYRTYFTGFDQDQKSVQDEETIYEVEPQGVERPIIDRPHLSAIFLSKGTFTWKVAFSVPVYRKSDPDEVGPGEIIGIVACTSEMGNFVEFENGKSQYATLIDGRPGDNHGAILEHPFFDMIETNPADIPKVEDIDSIRTSGKFFDPIAKLPEGNTFDKDWIAALEPVMTNSDYLTIVEKQQPKEQQNVESGLFVLVAEDFNSVITPVFELSSRLFWLAIFAILFFLTIALAMWFIVFGMLKESSRRLARSFATSGDSTFRSNSGTSGTGSE